MKLDVTAHHTYQSIREQERDLVAAAQRGNEAAMRILLQAHRPSILKVARHFANAAAGMGFCWQFDMDDAFACAVFGFARGVQKFDLEREVRLLTYALWWCRHEAERGMRAAIGDMRVPVNAQKAGHRPPKAMRLDAPVRAACGSVSKEMLGEMVPSNDPPPEEQMDAYRRAKELRDIYVRVLLDLDERERELVKVRLSRHQADQMTLEEIGAKWGISRERVRQIENRTRVKVRLMLTRMGAKRLGEAA